MKKSLFLALGFCFVTSLAFAQMASDIANTEAPAPAAGTVTIKGDVIDNTCATANKDNLAEFVKTHTKECALMPGCIESGYAILADGTLTKFDKDSNAKIAEFLKKPNSKLQVVVVANRVGDELSLVSIENQK